MNRRTFLSAAPVLAIAATPAIAAEPAMTPYEKAIWHLRELERLAIEDGAKAAMVTVVGRYWTPDFNCRTLMVDRNGEFIDYERRDGRPSMFSPSGEVV
jgi:hypothetical protein